MKFKKALFVFGISSLIISCAPQINHPDLEVVKSDSWIDSSQTMAYIDSAWWESFNDESLNNVIAMAFEKNYNHIDKRRS